MGSAIYNKVFSFMASLFHLPIQQGSKPLWEDEPMAGLLRIIESSR
jgi:hypothetical protein